MNKQMGLSNWALLATLSLIWGGSFYFVEIAVREVAPIAVVFGRVGFAAIFLWFYIWFRGVNVPKDARLWFGFLVMGALNNALPFCLIVWAQTEITGSLASILNATTPFFTIILAQFLTQDEKISLRKVFGVLFGLAGVTLMVGVDALAGVEDSVLAQLAMLGAAVSYGCAAIWGRRFQKIDPLVTATGQVTCSSLVMAPFVVLFVLPDLAQVPSLSAGFAIIMLALLCTVLAYILYFRILATSGATNLMLVTMLVPVSAIFLGSLLLSEALSAVQIGGMVLILTGLLVIDGRLLRQKC